MIFAIKMLLDNIYGLLNLFEFKINHFNSLVQAKSEFKNSNFGGKYIEIMSSLMFSNKYDFSSKIYFWQLLKLQKWILVQNNFVKLIYLISRVFLPGIF